MVEKLSEKLIAEDETIYLSMYQVDKQFNKYKGNNYFPKPLPYISDKQNEERVTWVIDMKNIMGKDKALVCFLGENWFYITG